MQLPLPNSETFSKETMYLLAFTPHFFPPPSPQPFNSVTQSCPTLWDPMDCSTPGFPVHHQLQEFISVESVMPSSHLILIVPFSSFSASGSFPMSQFFTLDSQSIGASASVLPMNIQDWFPLGIAGLISLLSKGLSRVFSNTTVQKHQFFGAQLSLWSNSHIHTWLLDYYHMDYYHSFDYTDLCQWSNVSAFSYAVGWS